MVIMFLSLIALPGGMASENDATGVAEVVEYVRKGFPLTVKVNKTGDDDLIGLPHPYTSPCIKHFFPELFYWDTYFINHGLRRVGMTGQARNNVDNFLIMTDRLGIVPSANRLSMANRSQTPFLSQMVRDVYQDKPDAEWLKSAVAVLKKDYDFWMTRRMSPCGLNRSGNDATEAYLMDFYQYLARDRFKGLALATREEQLAFSRQALSEAETWDFTPRYDRRAEDFCPVDQNSNLYIYEMNFAWFARILANGEEQAWLAKAEKRKALIQELLWNEKLGCYTDYDWKNKRQGDLVSCATLYPLVAGIASQQQAERVVAKMRAVLEFDHGLSTCEKRDHPFAYQWDYPNAWPPLQMLAIQALDRYGFKADARRIARKYVATVTRNFQKTGDLWEKYNAETGTTEVKDEYQMPSMIGWTAGVYLFAVEYLNKPESNDHTRGDLSEKFTNPPMTARPSCYWWWFNNLMDKPGITRDLEEARDKGMGGVMLVCSNPHCGSAGPIPEGPEYLSPEWIELYRFALQEADRLGLEVGVNLCGGWCMGGPWITPENAGRWYLQSETTVTGPKKISEVLPLPGPKDGYDSPPQNFVTKYINLPMEKVDYRDTAVVAFRDPGAGRISDDRAQSLPAKSNREDASCFHPARTAMDRPQTQWTAAPGDKPIAPEDVIDLTSKMTPDGRLEWEVPEGNWVIVRTGHRLIGHEVAVPMPGSAGLEVDWFSKEAVDQHWAGLAKILIDAAGPHVGNTLKYFCTDSFEDGYPNWTPKMLEEFKRFRGYDMTPYLPALMGRLVGSAEITNRFLYDYRKTIADCMADNNYGYLAELTHRHQMELAAEAAGPSWSGTLCMDGLKNLGRTDRPRGEFWMDLFKENNQSKVGKQTATAAHIYGRKTASAEAFTSFRGHWQDSPVTMKSVGDMAFCEGINRFLFHTWTATRPQDGKPGYEYGAGTHFNPNVTWWQIGAKPWLSYLGRCQAMLQSGLFVADVLYYNGDGAPNLVESKHTDPSLGGGYDYDVCNSEVLLTRLSVKNGRLVLPDGMSYRLLVLPENKTMPVAVATKIHDLVKAGATIVGPRPETDPGLKNYPACDQEIQKIAAAVWGKCDGISTLESAYGKGRVFWKKPLRDILQADGVAPDFEFRGSPSWVDYIHRRAGDAEIYFVVHRGGPPAQGDFIFRVSGMQPELWNPVDGTMRPLPDFKELEDGRTVVPMSFEPEQSLFVVFREKGRKTETKSPKPVKNFPTVTPVMEIAGPWTVRFDPKWFYPTDGLSGDAAKGRFVFDQLEDWTKRTEPAIQYFSGTARYRKVFQLPADLSPKLFLDLGTVKEMARVKLNGRDLGVVWCHPWRVDIGKAVKPGENHLEIDVVNLWPNRLAGDSKLPADQKRTKTNIPIDPNQPLIPSGLLGPVRVMAEE